MDDKGKYKTTINHDPNSEATRRTNRQLGNNTWQEPSEAKPDAETGPPQIQPDPTQPQYSDGFSMITPIESRRIKLQSMAQKEEEDFLRWKEENRPGPIQLAPSKIGGAVSLAEVRQRQQVELRQSKIQKQLRKQEMDRQQRQAEEEECERMKAKQREKAVRLAERKAQEERQRREVLQQDHLRRTEQFLQNVKRSETAPVALNLPVHTSPWARAQEYREGRREEENTELQMKKEKQRMMSEALEEKKIDQEEEMKREMRRGREAFLNRLQDVRAGGVVEQREEQHPLLDVEENSRDWQTHSQSSRPQDTTPPETIPAQSTSELGEETGSDFEWVVMKLQNMFSWYERPFLEDIVNQCDGDYQKAYDLMI
ncbi:hypothetical protein DPEC_G00048900 [Dallia pectoralis]|uniref:Uncharacterized protein n=1 Tax=Dallia pectoralis TaxID=75939 RepID=A0ACC2HAK2_DALPE|nr:hypothetical protein DPEC_G00048900 [Dallia pectoralis]